MPVHKEFCPKAVALPVPSPKNQAERRRQFTGGVRSCSRILVRTIFATRAISLGSCNRSYDILVTDARNSLNIAVSVHEVASGQSGWNSSGEKGRQLAKRVDYVLFVVVTVFASFRMFGRHGACLPEAVGHALLYAVPGTRNHVYGPQLVNFKLGAHAEVHEKPIEESPSVPNLERRSSGGSLAVVFGGRNLSSMLSSSQLVWLAEQLSMRRQAGRSDAPASVPVGFR
ncbi:hypothetical protein HPB48_017356 [Haemaphysalis longicornis]|uniref:Uncharacterized protein n=1 Tax=Haemaphysalis longicornis TaxID=44386 RepID=A0A9J6GA92_HAELO|nr:hypothetical protein HPB48_017356 [Haemaphysalis longicornis]